MATADALGFSCPHPTLPLSDISDLFFDAAGTLLRVRESVGTTYASVARAHHLSASPAALDQAFRQAWKEAHTASAMVSPRDAAADRLWWRQIVHRSFELALAAPPPASSFETLFGELFDFYGQASAWELYPDALPALTRLQPHFRLHILSNFDPRLLPVLEGLGIRRFFHHIFLSSEVGHRKPDSRIFAHALTHSAIAKPAALHIGDEIEADINGAQQSGLRAFHIQRPGQDLLSLCQHLLPI